MKMPKMGTRRTGTKKAVQTEAKSTPAPTNNGPVKIPRPKITPGSASPDKPTTPQQKRTNAKLQAATGTAEAVSEQGQQPSLRGYNIPARPRAASWMSTEQTPTDAQDEPESDATANQDEEFDDDGREALPPATHLSLIHI